MGTVILPDTDGVPHLAIPILQVDGAGNHYFFLANLGPLDSSEKCPVSLVPTRNNVGIVPETQWLTQTQLQTALNNLKGDIFNIFYEYANESFPNPSPLLQEFLKAKPIDRALADWTLRVSQPGVSYKSLLAEFPDIAKLINAYPTEVDATAMPFPSGFEVASLPK